MSQLYDVIHSCKYLAVLQRRLIWLQSQKIEFETKTSSLCLLLKISPILTIINQPHFSKSRLQLVRFLTAYILDLLLNLICNKSTNGNIDAFLQVL